MIPAVENDSPSETACSRDDAIIEVVEIVMTVPRVAHVRFNLTNTR